LGVAAFAIAAVADGNVVQMLLVSNVFTWRRPKLSAAIPSGLPGLSGATKGSVAKVETGIV
jgi:hypothetical protein